jgi:HEAT repeat protein
LPALKAAINHASPDVVNEALGSLAEFGEPAMPAIIAALKIKDSRGLAAAILGRMGKAAAPAVPALTEALSDDRPSVRREAAFALGAIGPDAGSATQALVKLLHDDETNDDHAVQYALGRIGPAAKDAIPALTKELEAEDMFERGVSAWALANIAPKDAALAKKTVPVLIKGLQNDQPMVRVECANALGLLGTNATTAVDALNTAAKDPNELVSAAATSAVKKIQSK